MILNYSMMAEISTDNIWKINYNKSIQRKALVIVLIYGTSYSVLKIPLNIYL